MADAVAEFYDPNTGRLQASATMASFVCRRTGTKATQARVGGNTSPSSLVIDVSGCSLPVVAVRSDQGYASAMSGAAAGPSVVFATNAPIGTTFTYYVFDWATALPEHDSEFQVRNYNDNTITFSNRFWPMLLIGGLNMYEGSGSPTFNGLSGTTLAHAEGVTGGHSRVNDVNCYDSGGPVVDPDLGGCSDIRGRVDGKRYGAITNGSQVIGTQVSFDDVVVRFGNYSAYSQYGGGWAVPNLVMIIDVSNIPIGVTFF